MKNLKTKKVLVTVLILLFGSNANAQVQFDVYAGFMVHFAKFVQWPSGEHATDFVIGVVGNTPLKAKLESMATSKTINGKKIIVKNVEKSSDLEACNMVFIPKTESSKIASLHVESKSKNVLLISEGVGNIAKGTTFNFIEKEGKIRFEYSQAEADAHGLKVSSDLVKLAILM